ncbi:hypothetical protein LCI18_014350 [Fusarium solani-melongenae]|uniref:Uncharacterized protein n=1 Tax=Fusarium solani subsp. cucurbitae TaxID=2747967 RepID=A0ACD3ZQB4_FUSSC|nr:hypothetical protein LCI18_014350 [Fusarium solani-melongenae]
MFPRSSSLRHEGGDVSRFNTSGGTQNNNIGGNQFPQATFHGPVVFGQGDARQYLQDLRETDPRDHKTRIQSAKGGLLEDCYRWILDNHDFQRWRDDPRSQLLWIKGDPGKGKTMLLCGIIDQLEMNPNNRLSYFFCQATEEQQNNATAVLRGLIFLLVGRQPSLTSYVQERYDSAGGRLFEGKNAWEALSKILAAMLNDSHLNGAILIIDALDECKEDRQKLLHFITKTPRVKWLVSSRNWPEIEQTLNTAQQKVWLQLELNKDSISMAVDMYIRKKVDELADLKTYTPEIRNHVQRHLVALVCQELADPDVLWEESTLTKLKSFPPGLDSLYKRMMEKICGSPLGERCKEVLAIASVVYRPINLDELKALAELPQHFSRVDLRKVITFCGSFLTLRDDVDYLLNKASDQILRHGIAHQHRSLFLTSVGVLSRTLCRNIYGLVGPGASIDEVSLLNPDPLAHVRYLCEHWVNHVEDANPAEKATLSHLQDGGSIHIFLQQKYLYWLEAMSLQRSISQAVLAVQKLQALVAAAGAQRLTDLVGDAHRFIQSCRGAIEIAPLQLYASALIFSPAQSQVRNLFKHDIPSWVTSPSQTQLDWSACEQTLEGHGSPVWSVAFTADGRRLASGSGDNTIKIWDADNGQCVKTLEGHDDEVNSVAFAADNKWLASGSSDSTIKVWHKGQCKQTLEGHGGPVLSVAFIADSMRLISGSEDNIIKVWHEGQCTQTLEGHGGWTCTVAFTMDGIHVASGSGDMIGPDIWNMTTGQCIETLSTERLEGLEGLEGPDDTITSMAFTTDGTRFISGSYDHTIRLWDTYTGQCLRKLQGHGGVVLSLAFAANGTQIASGSEDGTVKVWDVATAQCVQTLDGHSYSVLSVAFAANGMQLASGVADFTIRVWDIATGQCLHTLESGHLVWSVTYSTDGIWLASGSLGNIVTVWNATTGQYLHTLKGHEETVISIAFGADGPQLASGSIDRTVKIWNAALGTCLQTLKAHSDWVSSVAFTSDGTWVASGSDDKTVKI